MAKAAQTLIIESHYRKRLHKLSLKELVLILDATKLATEAWLAIANQPRAMCTEDGHELLEDEQCRCDVIHDLIFKEASRRQPKDVKDIEAWAYICTESETRGGSWRRVADIALKVAVAQEAHAATRKSRAS